MKLIILLLVTTCLSLDLSDAPFIFYKKEAQSCQDAIVESLLDLEDLSNAFYILSNGKFLNNWGSYDSCMKSALGSNFWMVTVTGEQISDQAQPTTVSMWTGLCVPHDCTKDNLQNGLEAIFKESAIFAGLSNPQVEYENTIEFWN